MKLLLFFPTFFLFQAGISQNLQLHYDFRHSLDPELHANNYPCLSFEYFRNLDTLSTGSLLFKMQADLNGEKNNTGLVFTQISQSIKFWKPGIYLAAYFSGGLGVTSDMYGFYLHNSFALGISYPFQWHGAWISANLYFRYNAFKKASYDPQFILYLGKDFYSRLIFISGSFVCWTQNLDKGDETAEGLHGKIICAFGDPQVWIRILGGLAAGSKINLYYHLFPDNRPIKFYPTLGIKYEF